MSTPSELSTRCPSSAPRTRDNAPTDRPPESSPAEILVLRALGLGDLLVAVPALRALRRAYPHARITLAAPEPLRELVELIDAVDALLPTSGLGALRWHGSPPGLAVNLHGSGPESIADLLATQPEALLTHRHPEHPATGGPAWQEYQHEARRWCGLLEHFGIPAEDTDLDLPRPPTVSHAQGCAVVVLHPGAAYPARQWPPRRFAAVAAELARRGYRVVVTGSAGEVQIAQDVATLAGLDGVEVLAGHTGLSELAATVADAALVVCGDTGVGHLATAYRTPSVLLFGPTPPERWGPPERPQHRVLWAGECGDPFAAEPDPGLLRIEPTQVVVEGLRVAHRVPAGAGTGWPNA